MMNCTQRLELTVSMGYMANVVVIPAHPPAMMSLTDAQAAGGHGRGGHDEMTRCDESVTGHRGFGRRREKGERETNCEFPVFLRNHAMSKSIHADYNKYCS